MQHAHDMDYYDLLGVDRSSSPNEITRAFHRLARQYHPDLHPQDSEADRLFKRVNEAYQVLSDPEKRALYDQQVTSPHPASRPAASTGYPQDESAGLSQDTEVIHREDIEGAVADLAAIFETFANQAADDMREALRDFGAELDTLSQAYHDVPGNRKIRRGLRPPPDSTLPLGGRPPWNGRPPRDGKPPWNGRPPRDGKAPKP